MKRMKRRWSTGYLEEKGTMRGYAVLERSTLMPEMKRLSDEEIMVDFCKTCDYLLEGCLEHEQQSTCASYQEALRQKRKKG